MSAEEKDRLLLAILPHVAFDGWGEEALRRGAEDLGMAAAAARELLPGGARGQVLAFADWADRAMLAGLAAGEPEGLGTTARVAHAVRLRFEALAPYEEAVRGGLRILALPSAGLSGLTSLHRTSDAIWNAVGDRSTDHNWYSKRLLLGGVISATTLYWLDDRSEGKQRTWAFLERRLRDVVRIGGRLGRGMNEALSLPDRLAQRLQQRRAWRRPVRRPPL